MKGGAKSRRVTSSAGAPQKFNWANANKMGHSKLSPAAAQYNNNTNFFGAVQQIDLTSRVWAIWYDPTKAASDLWWMKRVVLELLRCWMKKTITSGFWLSAKTKGGHSDGCSPLFPIFAMELSSQKFIPSLKIRNTICLCRMKIQNLL